MLVTVYVGGLEKREVFRLDFLLRYHWKNAKITAICLALQIVEKREGSAVVFLVLTLYLKQF